MALQCSICLSRFSHPTCLPCGHIYCKKCIVEYVNCPSNDGMDSSCPECRAPFQTAIPDLTYLPKKYHPFISPALRRVYIDFSSHTDLEKRLRTAEKKLETRKTMEEGLLNKCEGLTRALAEHKRGEAEANARVADLEEEVEEWEDKYIGMEQDLKKEIEKLEADKKKLSLKCARLTKDAGVMQSKIDKLEQERFAGEDDSDSSSSDDSDSSEPTYVQKTTKGNTEYYNIDTGYQTVSISVENPRRIKPLPKRVHRIESGNSLSASGSKRARI